MLPRRNHSLTLSQNKKFGDKLSSSKTIALLVLKKSSEKIVSNMKAKPHRNPGYQDNSSEIWLAWSGYQTCSSHGDSWSDPGISFDTLKQA